MIENIIPKIKINENVVKITTPGFKQVHRLYSKSDSRCDCGRYYNAR